MAIGTVKWFCPKRGFGFILPETGPEVMFHWSAIDGSQGAGATGGFRKLRCGQKVEYEPVAGAKGMTASRVRSVEA